MTQIKLNDDQQSMLKGEKGVAKQMGMRLLLDMAAAANATELLSIKSAHLSGVSPLTGGLGLRLFLKKLAKDPKASMAIPTTLNSAGCDEAQFDEMRIVAPNFLEHNHEIVELYTQIGVRPTQSCIPYEWEGVVVDGVAAWAESNAICFGNSYTGLITNRESGLSALACALTGYIPAYGLLQENNRKPNIAVIVTAKLDDPTDFSILGDWIGMQRDPSWKMPYGPIPAIKGIPADITHEQKKALTAAAANYGSPMVYIDSMGTRPQADFQARLIFDEAALAERYEALRAKTAVSLITIGCPQASVGEMKAVAELLNGKKVATQPVESGKAPPVWVFTSSANKAIAEKTGIAKIITDSGALLLENTCPEVVPYDRSWVKHILTNSMKAEHYIKSGLNGIPTSVMRLADCIRLATGAWQLATPETSVDPREKSKPSSKQSTLAKVSSEGAVETTASSAQTFSATGSGLPSQSDFEIVGEAFVTDTPITLLGFVNRKTGTIEEPTHPADGQSMAGKIAIFPKGSGSTVAPYVLLELFYRGNAPIAIVNTEIDQQSAPACSLEGIPYAYGFDQDIIANIQNGETVKLSRKSGIVSIQTVH
ncbi:MAG: aconitase X [Chloroflexota bacterium]